MPAVSMFLMVAALTSLSLDGVGSAVAVAQAQQNVVVDFPPTPPTLRELLGKIDLAVLARVERTSPAQADIKDGAVRVLRRQQLLVLEVLKGQSATAKTGKIVVRQTGGTVEHEARQYSANYITQLFEPGDTVLLFLKRVPNSDEYDIAYGKDGAAWVDSARNLATLPPGLRRMPETAGRGEVPLHELLQIVRKSRTQF